jgi:hypothetical protein
MFQELLKAIMEFLISVFRDLRSFRNKLVVFSCYFIVEAGMRVGTPEVMLGCITVLSALIAYYLKTRVDTTPKN